MGYILKQKVLADVSNSLRDRGDSVVFTHGAFDLFHVGHLELLKQSLKLGDLLIVGVESDERIAKYKINFRPIIPFKERLDILKSLKVVDFVLPITGTFSEGNYQSLYRILKPNIVTFGRKFAGKEKIKTEKSF